MAICQGSDHPNIVQILRHGWLGVMNMYFIDMELCELHLGRYMKGERPSFYSSKALNSMSIVPTNASLHARVKNTFVIMSHIASGLKHVHEYNYAHRDLKPPNGIASMSSLMSVLFSTKTSQWKITDFGLTSSATSREPITSHRARGTEGYYAPELLSEDHPTFTKKVDMFALGCLLYEIFDGKKAFHDNWSIQRYAHSAAQIIITLSDVPSQLRSHVQQCVDELLQRDPILRPNITETLPLFESYCTLLNDSISETLDEIEAVPTYSEWKRWVVECKSKEQLLSRLSKCYEDCHSDWDARVRRASHLVDMTPDDSVWASKLAVAFNGLGDPNRAIAGWRELVDKHPAQNHLQNHLAAAYESLGERDRAIAGWRDLVEKHPEQQNLQNHLAAAYKSLGGGDKAIAGWRDLVEKYPEQQNLQNHLAAAYESLGDGDRAVASWRDSCNGSNGLAKDAANHPCRGQAARGPAGWGLSNWRDA